MTLVQPMPNHSCEQCHGEVQPGNAVRYEGFLFCSIKCYAEFKLRRAEEP